MFINLILFPALLGKLILLQLVYSRKMAVSLIKTAVRGKSGEHGGAKPPYSFDAAGVHALALTNVLDIKAADF